MADERKRKSVKLVTGAGNGEVHPTSTVRACKSRIVVISTKRSLCGFSVFVIAYVVLC